MLTKITQDMSLGSGYIQKQMNRINKISSLIGTKSVQIQIIATQEKNFDGDYSELQR